MRSVTSKTDRTAHFTIGQAAWLLAVDEATVCRAIRTGTLRTVHCRGRLLIPSTSLTPLLEPRPSQAPEQISSSELEGGHC